MSRVQKKTRASAKSSLVDWTTSIFSMRKKRGMSAHKRVLEIEKDVRLSYVRCGVGRPMIFIPGWTMTAGFFSHQIEYFSKDYDVISLNPRSHGDSSDMGHGNNYKQHGRDLQKFLEALKLTDVILVGWSFGVLDIYSYIEQFGDENVRALVLIDQGPASLPDKDYGWALGDTSDLQGFAEALREDRTGFVEQFLKSCFSTAPTKKDLRWMLNESLRTPDNVAIELIYDGWLRDYRKTANCITVPVLNIVRESWGQDAASYLSSAMSNSELFVLGQHLMFWEFKDELNARLSKFMDAL